MELHYKYNEYNKVTVNQHWIIRKLDEMGPLPDIRSHMEKQSQQGNFTFFQKTRDQKWETRTLANSAKSLFKIFIKCPFVPVNYLILLAIIMDEGNNLAFQSMEANLNNNHKIDLLMNTGIIIITEKMETDIGQDDIVEINQGFALLSHNQETQLPKTVTNTQVPSPTPTLESQNLSDEPFPSEEASRTFMGEPLTYLQDEDIILQHPLQDDIDNIHRGHPLQHLQQLTDHQNDWLLDDNTEYVPSYQSTSASDIPSQVESDDPNNILNIMPDNHTMEVMPSGAIGSDPLSLSEHTPEEAQIQKATLYVPDVDNNARVSNLLEIFEEFGLVRFLYKNPKPGPENRYALVTYISPLHAETAMTTLNKEHNTKITYAINQNSTIFPDQEVLPSSSKQPSFIKLVTSRKGRIRKTQARQRSSRSKTYRKNKRLMDGKNHPLVVANGLLGHWMTHYDFQANMMRDMTGAYAQEIIKQLSQLTTATIQA